MKRNSISALIAAVLAASAALAGCASISDGSFFHSENATMPIDREGTA